MNMGIDRLLLFIIFLLLFTVFYFSLIFIVLPYDLFKPHTEIFIFLISLVLAYFSVDILYHLREK